ncbi:hypothetical protein F0562_016259 [Nyssa sinensis]|uniref:Uncharacterized protein n=1 Tax=Nyssa sinensis TaxID=561372 RepID=A0A5J4ZP97_9ASTE|nr:hypothetical protein F0562_016259 [Nyssa sinensis]
MAEDLDDGEFWLPPQILTDDDILRDYNCGNNIKSIKGEKFSRESDTGVCFPHEYSYGFGSFAPYSNLSSPVESVVGSTETESDEEDYIAGLTRKMAHSTLQDDLWKGETGFGYENQKSLTMSGSPQSTLCPVLGGCGCKPGSSHGSPSCPSRISSPSPPPPPAAAMARNEAAWDLLYAAAGEVAKMRMIEEGSGYYHNRELMGLPRKPGPVFTPPTKLNPKPNCWFSLQSISVLPAIASRPFSAVETATDDEATGLGGLGTVEGDWTVPTAAGRSKQGTELRCPTSGSITLCLAYSAAVPAATATKWFWHEGCISWKPWVEKGMCRNRCVLASPDWNPH